MMKKMCAFLMAMVMSLSLVACGGVDIQPAIDAFNNASTAYDAVSNKVNAEIGAYPEEFIDTMNELADTMLEYKAVLESGEELTEEQVNEMITVFAEVEKWATETEPKLDEFKTIGADKQPAIDAFNKTSTAFDAVVEVINANPELYGQDVIDLMTQMSDTLTECKTLLESETMLTEDVVSSMVTQLTDIEAWIAEFEAEILVDPEEAAGAAIDLTSAIEYFNAITTAFDATATAVNSNADAFTEEFKNTMINLSEVLTQYKGLLEGGYEFSEEEYNLMIEDFEAIEQWLLEVESDVFG